MNLYQTLRHQHAVGVLLGGGLPKTTPSPRAVLLRGSVSTAVPQRSTVALVQHTARKELSHAA